MAWSVELFVLVFISGAGVGYATCLYQRRSRKIATVVEPMKHRLQMLFDSSVFDAQRHQAIDLFIQSVAVTSQTLPVHIAVGRYFRQQGEVDKAILIHQNLIAHPELSEATSESVIFELARDYHKAGLLDRAETLLLELSKSKDHTRPSKMLLLELYEQERDWHKAIATVLSIGNGDDASLRLRLAHYYCELAEEADARHTPDDIIALYRKAIATSVECVRATLALAHIHLHEGRNRQAFEAAKEIIDASEFIALAVPVLERCLDVPDMRDSVLAYLDAHLTERQSLPILLLLLQQVQGSDRAQSIERRLMGLPGQFKDVQALHYCVEQTDSGRQCLIEPLRQHVVGYLERQSREHKPYQCQRCGFSGLTLYWQCPGCHDWQSIHPVLG